MTKDSKKTKQVAIRLPEIMLEQIENYRMDIAVKFLVTWPGKTYSKAEAIRSLIGLGLRKHKEEEQNDKRTT